MEDKIRKYLEELANKQVNLTSEFAREQMTADIMRIIEKYPTKSWDAGRQQRLEIATKAMQGIIIAMPNDAIYIVFQPDETADKITMKQKIAKEALEFADTLLKEEEK